MIKRICFLNNYNLYESKRHFTLKLSEALNEKGIVTNIIDVNESVLGFAGVELIRKFKPDLTCSFNSLLPINDNKFLWDFLEIPHLAVLVDPAIYSMNLLKSPFSIISTVDLFDYQVIRDYPFPNVFFWPHAIEKNLYGDPKSDRPYDVVFFGSCYDYESLRVSWRQQNPVTINKVLDDAIDIVLSDNRTSIAEALTLAWNNSGLSIEGVDFMTLFYYIDNYTRGKDRVELIRSIKDAQVHVFGDLSQDNAVGILGWPQYLAKQSNVKVHASLPFSKSLEVLKQSKISLNSMPFFKNGTHERVFTALACGALPLTTDNLYFRANFKNGEDLLFYPPKQWSDVNGQINTFLKDEKKREKLVAKGREKVMRSHTWDIRVDQLLKQLPEILDRIHTSVSHIKRYTQTT